MRASIVRGSGASAGPIWGLAAVVLGLLPFQALGQRAAREQVTLPQAIERALKSDPRTAPAAPPSTIAPANRVVFGQSFETLLRACGGPAEAGGPGRLP